MCHRPKDNLDHLWVSTLSKFVKEIVCTISKLKYLVIFMHLYNFRICIHQQSQAHTTLS